MTKNPRRSEISIFIRKHADYIYTGITDNGQMKNILYRLSRHLLNKSTPGGQTGVPAVPKELLVRYINDYSMIQWCPYGVPKGHLLRERNQKFLLDLLYDEIIYIVENYDEKIANV